MPGLSNREKHSDGAEGKRKRKRPVGVSNKRRETLCGNSTKCKEKGKPGGGGGGKNHEKRFNSCTGNKNWGALAHLHKREAPYTGSTEWGWGEKGKHCLGAKDMGETGATTTPKKGEEAKNPAWGRRRVLNTTTP